MSDFSTIGQWQGELTAWRRHLHVHPELGFEERGASAFIQETLSCGVDEIHRDPNGTMVVAEVHGRSTGHSIGLRADIDALPIQEQSGVPYASTTPGVMHACGHYGHTTMLLGAARYLAASRNFNGKAYLIFNRRKRLAGPGGSSMKASSSAIQSIRSSACTAYPISTVERFLAQRRHHGRGQHL
jgi:metal-dependent amidase/aminoacylase/carboxypeptidase family protein